MPEKCVHKGCGKFFEEPDEDCVYHSGPPIFHEGQKGWKCCKPRVLTFDEFLTIPPCTTGKHSTTDELPAPKAEINDNVPPPAPDPIPTEALNNYQVPPPAPQPPEIPIPSPPSPVLSEDEDDPSLPLPVNATCRRRGCGVTSTTIHISREGEKCVYHPGHPLFHEGIKGWTCCKKKVLEFDEFMKIQGCTTKDKHLFVGTKNDQNKETALGEVRHDFYQTTTTVIASFFLKKIDHLRAKVDFSSIATVDLDLPTSDNKRYSAQIPLFGHINTAASSFKILNTKLELTLVKGDSKSWRSLRSDEQGTSQIIQVGGAQRA